jgi:hypothetical protein
MQTETATPTPEPRGVLGTLRVDAGLFPWQPTPGTHEIARYRMADDFPLVGVVEQDGSLFLYQCVLGQGEQVNIWTYTPLLEHERRAIEDASPRRAAELIARLGRRPGQIAIAHRSVGLIAVRPLGHDADTGDEVNRLFGALDDYWAQLRAHTLRVRRGVNTSPVAATAPA